MSLSDRYSTILDKCVGSLATWKNFINENMEGSDKDTQMAKLQQIAEEYCLIDENHKRSENAIKSVDEAITNPLENYSIDELYNKKLEEQPNNDPTTNEIWEQLFNNNASIQEIIPKKKKDKTQYEAVDDSLLCSSSFTAPVDPITKTIIRKPIRNKKCKHVYDNQSIYDYIRQSKNKAKCPYMGCKNNKLVVGDLQEDAQLEEKITQYLQSQANEEDSEDDDDSD